MRLWLGLTLNSFLGISVTLSLKIDQILSSFLELKINKILVWAGPEHFPLNLNYILIEN